MWRPVVWHSCLDLGVYGSRGIPTMRGSIRSLRHRRCVGTDVLGKSTLLGSSFPGRQCLTLFPRFSRLSYTQTLEQNR
jgi:hypothetical protein